MKFSELEVGDTIIFKYNQPLDQDAYIVKRKFTKNNNYIYFDFYKVKENFLYKDVSYSKYTIIEASARVIKNEFNILDYV